MAEDDDSKTEQPTGRKLSRAREEGDLLQSQEVKSAAMLIAILAAVWAIAPMTMRSLARLLAVFLEHAATLRVDTGPDFGQVAWHTLLHVALVMAAPMGLFLLVSLAASVGQVGLTFTPGKLVPDLSRLNLLAGLGRMFSPRSLVDLVKSIAKIAAVGSVAVTVVWPEMEKLRTLPMLDLWASLHVLHRALVKLLAAAAILMVVIAVADWVWQRFSYMRKMRMTRQEVKDEQKQTEGDPMIKARLRSLRVQRARQRMMAAVPKADVVVTNPTHFACALKYDMDTMAAPVLVAKGQDLVAVRIRQIAEENDVPVVENPPLARALHATVDVDAEIPPEHYKAVAEVISYVFRLKGRIKR